MCIKTRYIDLLNCALEPHTAKVITKYVRQSALKTLMEDGSMFIKEFIDADLDEEYIIYVEGINFMQSKHWMFSKMNTIIQIAYNKAHFREQFIDVLDQKRF